VAAPPAKPQLAVTPATPVATVPPARLKKAQSRSQRSAPPTDIDDVSVSADEEGGFGSPGDLPAPPDVVDSVEDDDFGEAMVAEAAARSRRLNNMIQSGDFTYVANKLTELSLVRQQTMHQNARFDLLYNPILVRAVMEIVGAKETQIQRKFQLGELDQPAFQQLMAWSVSCAPPAPARTAPCYVPPALADRAPWPRRSLEETRMFIAQRTNSNTITRTRRLLGRTKTMTEFRPASLQRLTVEAAQPASVRTPTSPMSRPVSASSGRSRTSSRATPIASLMEICFSEAFTSVFTGIKDDLLELLLSVRAAALHAWVLKKWTALAPHVGASGVDAATLHAQARFLDSVTRSVEANHPQFRRFRDVRARVKQMLVMLDLLEVQMRSGRLGVV
jgi:hypothetical protein